MNAVGFSEKRTTRAELPPWARETHSIAELVKVMENPDVQIAYVQAGQVPEGGDLKDFGDIDRYTKKSKGFVNFILSRNMKLGEHVINHLLHATIEGENSVRVKSFLKNIIEELLTAFSNSEFPRMNSIIFMQQPMCYATNEDYQPYQWHQDRDSVDLRIVYTFYGKGTEYAENEMGENELPLPLGAITCHRGSGAWHKAPQEDGGKRLMMVIDFAPKSRFDRSQNSTAQKSPQGEVASPLPIPAE